MCHSYCFIESRSINRLLFVTAGLTILYWFILVPVLFVSLDAKHCGENWGQHWELIYFAVSFLLWGVFMFAIVVLWYFCRSNFYKKLTVNDGKNGSDENEAAVKLKEVNVKARRTLGLEEADYPDLLQKESKFLRKNSLVEARKRESAIVLENEAQGNLEFENKEITPLPEYSPHAKNTIFDFSETTLETELKRSSSPFQEFLHLVQIESPKSPELTLVHEVTSEINEKCKFHEDKAKERKKLGTNEKYPAPIVTESLLKQPFPKKKVSIINEIDEEESKIICQKENVKDKTEDTSGESKENGQLEEEECVTDKQLTCPTDEQKEPKKEKPPLTKKESCMFLGKIGRADSDVAEMFFEVSKGVAVLESVVITGKSQVLTELQP